MTIEALNKGDFVDNIHSADLFFIERLSSLGGSKCIAGTLLGSHVLSFVERFILLYPYLGESALRGITVDVSLYDNVLHTVAGSGRGRGWALCQLQVQWDLSNGLLYTGFHYLEVIVHAYN